jgi:hypothetical protein
MQGAQTIAARRDRQRQLENWLHEDWPFWTFLQASENVHSASRLTQGSSE